MGDRAPRRGGHGRAVDRLQHWRTAPDARVRGPPRSGGRRSVPSRGGVSAGIGTGGRDPGHPRPPIRAPRTFDRPSDSREERWLGGLAVPAGDDGAAVLGPVRTGAHRHRRPDPPAPGAHAGVGAARPVGDRRQGRAAAAPPADGDRGGGGAARRATLERRWQVARWIDGSVNVWLQRSKRLGRGERSAGLRWDTLEDV